MFGFFFPSHGSTNRKIVAKLKELLLLMQLFGVASLILENLTKLIEVAVYYLCFSSLLISQLPNFLSCEFENWL